MGTYVQWLKEQEHRENDPVGWFAQFWRDLPDKPRLSAPASISKHLEDRDLFRLTPGLTEAHDTALSEYRKQREQTVRAVATEAGVQVPQGEPEQGLAGQAVQRATEAAVQAAQAHMPGYGQQVQGELFSAQEAHPETGQLDRIEHMLKMIMQHLGLAITADRIASGSITYTSWQPEDWDAMYRVADLSAVPDA
jgi:hypothetical protein